MGGSKSLDIHGPHHELREHRVRVGEQQPLAADRLVDGRVLPLAEAERLALLGRRRALHQRLLLPLQMRQLLRQLPQLLLTPQSSTSLHFQRFLLFNHPNDTLRM